ncbi:MAG TPA: hypothetical protein VI875_02215 [Candidatus Norongarragalinales archaeon]|nr:hypothetical protein [Candidatus Norongarragalinales archaeon]
MSGSPSDHKWNFLPQFKHNISLLPSFCIQNPTAHRPNEHDVQNSCSSPQHESNFLPQFKHIMQNHPAKNAETNH